MSSIIAVYRVLSDATSIKARAQAIAVEQSVEMPLEAISDQRVLREIAGQVQDISAINDALFEVRIAFSAAMTGFDAGQLLNVLFGNTSLQDDVTLWDAELPNDLSAYFRGPNLGIEGLRSLTNVTARALTCTALKPQGLDADQLAALAGRLAAGGIDFIKDDHSLADQVFSPFKARIGACAEAIRRANERTGFSARYVPNISGAFESAAAQIDLAISEGIEAVLIEPIIFGLANFHALVKRFTGIAFFTHPALAGASRIAPPLLLGKLLRLFGADVTIYPNFGGRFSYSRETCAAIASAARNERINIRRCFPAPAGGMTLDRVPELLDFYGPDTMLLIGGSLLSAKERLTEEAASFVARVAGHFQSHGQ